MVMGTKGGRGLCTKYTIVHGNDYELGCNE